MRREGLKQKQKQNKTNSETEELLYKINLTNLVLERIQH